MFHGSLPDSVQQIMGDCIRDWKCTDIYVGCSGNFTIERMLKSVTNARLHGNDVTIYSCLLGRYFSGAPLNARFNENYEGPMEFIQEYMKTDLDIATCVLLLSKMSTYLGSKPNPYYVRTPLLRERSLNLLLTPTGKLGAEWRNSICAAKKSSRLSILPQEALLNGPRGISQVR